MSKFRLYGRVFIRGTIVAKTGLHIGGSEGAITIGGVDNTVIRDPLSGRPYIPGSSLKGKMRSLTEKNDGLQSNQRIGRDVHIHVCQTREEYEDCDVCNIFGVPAENYSLPTRLIVRDVPLTDKSAKDLEALQTDLPYTEVKTEVAIDRVTSAAVPRQLERVPAGAEFGDFELVFSLYDGDDSQRFEKLVSSLSLVEDDYLGGSGTRGSGKIAFERISVGLKKSDSYLKEETLGSKEPYETLDKLIADLDHIQSGIAAAIPSQDNE